MPKTAIPPFPLSLLFALNKPPNMPSMSILNSLQPLFASSKLFRDPSLPDSTFDDSGGKGKRGKGGKRGRRGNSIKDQQKRGERVKMGQGGTLDPLADGVLVIALNSATKQLSSLLDCPKSYSTTALLGCETDSYDSDGKVVRWRDWRHVTKESVEKSLEKFRGQGTQVPPIYSALKMDGKPLYEYARSNIPLPRPIEPRPCTFHSLDLADWKEGDIVSTGTEGEFSDAMKTGHGYGWPKGRMESGERETVDKLEGMIREGLKKEQEGEDCTEMGTEIKEEDVAKIGQMPPAFSLSMSVSSGTYVRTLVHDIGIAVGSAAHVVKLTRTRQGDFSLDTPPSSSSLSNPSNLNPSSSTSTSPPANTTSDSQQSPETIPSIPWELFEKGLRDLEKRKALSRGETDGDGGDSEKGKEKAEYEDWESAILENCKFV